MILIIILFINYNKYQMSELNLYSSKYYNIDTNQVCNNKKTEDIIGNRFDFNNHVFNNWNISHIHIRKYARTPILRNYILISNITDDEHFTSKIYLPDKIEFNKVNLVGNLLTIEIPMVSQLPIEQIKKLYDIKNKQCFNYNKATFEFILTDDARIKTEKFLISLPDAYLQQETIINQ